MRIDAHQHFWKYDPALYGWMTDAMQTLRRDYLPGDLAPLLAEASIDGSVAVQARQDLDETRWLLALADENPFIRGVVGWVDLRSPEREAQLDELGAHPRFKGVRHVVQDEPDDEFLLGAEFCAGIAGLAARGLVYDVLIYPEQLDASIRFVDRFPDQPFVLDHMAKPLIEKGTLEPWAAQIKELGKREHVCCKVSGMVTEASWEGWAPADFEPYLDVVFEAFGPERLMYGSDWPVCRLASEYAPMRSIITEYAGRLTSDERGRLLGTNAARFYGLQQLEG